MDKLQYKGYTCLLSHSKNSERLCGVIYAPGKTDVPVEDIQIFGKDVNEINDRFVSKIDFLIHQADFQSKLEKWKSEIDYLSVAAVMNILPDVFERRIKNGDFDSNLLQGVVGHDYVVPLYYVTKAWDLIMRMSTDDGLFYLSISDSDKEDPDFNYRTRLQAIEENERLKTLWKCYFNIDIDALEIDFLQYNMHMPPNVSEHDSWIYFCDPPNGMDEWITDFVFFPSEDWILHDAVSSLMELAAMVTKNNAFGK